MFAHRHSYRWTRRLASSKSIHSYWSIAWDLSREQRKDCCSARRRKFTDTFRTAPVLFAHTWQLKVLVVDVIPFVETPRMTDFHTHSATKIIANARPIAERTRQLMSDGHLIITARGMARWREGKTYVHRLFFRGHSRKARTAPEVIRGILQTRCSIIRQGRGQTSCNEEVAHHVVIHGDKLTLFETEFRRFSRESLQGDITSHLPAGLAASIACPRGEIGQEMMAGTIGRCTLHRVRILSSDEIKQRWHLKIFLLFSLDEGETNNSVEIEKEKATLQQGYHFPRASRANACAHKYLSLLLKNSDKAKIKTHERELFVSTEAQLCSYLNDRAEIHVINKVSTIAMLSSTITSINVSDNDCRRLAWITCNCSLIFVRCSVRQSSSCTTQLRSSIDWSSDRRREV